MSQDQLTPEMKQLAVAQQRAIKQCGVYYLGNHENHNTVNGFDSINVPPEKRPEVLQELLDMPVFKKLTQDEFDSLVQGIDEAVQQGCLEYSAKNGGNKPSPDVIAMALTTARQSVDEFDSMTNLQPEQASLAPEVPKITILTVISSACPIIAYLPNTSSSYQIPLILMRLITDSSRAGLKQGEYLDMGRTGQPYLSGRYEFALTKADDGSYGVVAHANYLNADASTKKPDETSPILPFQTSNASICLNGIEIGHGRGFRANSVYNGKDVKLNAVETTVNINDTEYELVGGTVNEKTGVISVKLNKELPKDAELVVRLRADLTSKDSNKNFRLNPVGAQIHPLYDFVQAGVMRFGITLSTDVIEQLQNEVNIGAVPYALGALQSVYFLENHIRLLQQGKARAVGRKQRLQFDVSRGVSGNFANAFNGTPDIIRELLKYISKAKQNIIRASGGASSSFVLYVSSNMAVWLNQLDKSEFTSTGLFSKNGQIVQIGTFTDGTPVYETPQDQNVLKEGDTTAEVMLVGRSSDPVQNPCVCSIVKPPTLETAKPDVREGYYGCVVVEGTELNPLAKFADQFVLIQVINLLKLDELK